MKYKIEPKKGKKEVPSYNCLFLNDQEDVGSTNLDEYERMIMEGGAVVGTQGAFLSDSNGQGVYYADDAWFT